MGPTFGVEITTVLLLIAMAVAFAVKWIRVPYSIALVLVGLLISVFHLLPPVVMTPELILLVFLPALLFEASWNLDLHELKANWLSISVLATVGVVLSMVIMATMVHLWAGMALPAALLFGAMLSATDPISVLAVFRQLGMNKRLALILEGESLFNDGTAVVIFQLVLAAVLANANVSSAFPLLNFGKFIIAVAGGGAIGLFMGLAASKITTYFDDHLLELTLTTVTAYGSFLIATQMGVSAVIAVVTAGIVLGNYGSRTGMSASTRIAVDSFWEFAAFVVNSLVFLLIGLQVNLSLLAKYVWVIAIAVVAMLVSRLVVAYLLCPLLSSKTLPISMNWRHLLFWGALRGSLAMAMALSLPYQIPYREELIVVTFGVVLFTLVVQGLTMEPLVKLLNSKKPDLVN